MRASLVVCRFALAGLLLAVLLTPIQAGVSRETFGDVQVIVEAPEGSSSHGYTEYRVTLVNKGSAPRRITLTMPQSRYDFGGGGLRSLSRTIEVAENATVRTALYAPPFPAINGTGLEVRIDGRRFETSLSVEIPPISLAAGYGRHGGYYPPRAKAPYTSVLHPHQPLVLTSARVKPDFAEQANPKEIGGVPIDPRLGLPAPGAPGPPVVGPPFELPIRHMAYPSIHFTRLDSPMPQWPTNWLGYSRYDGVVLTAEDLRELSAEARQALWQSIEAGGVLLVLGKADLPESWFRHPALVENMALYDASFGRCLMAADPDYTKWSDAQWMIFQEILDQSSTPFRNFRNAAEANQAMPVVEDIGVPVRGLFTLMLGFAVVIGPVNMVVLGRMGKRLWLLVTIPLLSFLTCVAVFGYMAYSEGWSGHLRTEALTLLDESSRRASTIGWTGVYSPLSLSDGLRYSTETELTYQGAPAFDWSADVDCALDWTQDQHLGRGWVAARVPSHFMVRKSETRRERVVVRRGTDGKLTIVNGLGAEMKRFWYRDEQNGLFTATDVPAGAEVPLQHAADMSNDPPPPAAPPVPLRQKNTRRPGEPIFEEIAIDQAAPEPAVPKPEELMKLPGGLRSLYAMDWLHAMRQAAGSPGQYLRPRSYIAELSDCPFVEDGLKNTQSRRARSVVIGVNVKPGQDK